MLAYIFLLCRSFTRYTLKCTFNVLISDTLLYRGTQHTLCAHEITLIQRNVLYFKFPLFIYEQWKYTLYI